MNYVNVKFDKECQEKLIEGVNLCVKAVETTYGPEGRNSLISDTSGLLITKDGFHTAMAVNDPDPYISMGIKLVQDTCKKTAKDVGDGTSTCAILIRELVNHYGSLSPKQGRELISNINKVIEFVSANKQEITSKEDLIDVATISANNDREIGELIANAFERVGKDGIVSFETSEEVRDRVEYSEGFRVDAGYSSPYFINTAKGTCELENVRVYISDTKMEEVKKVIALADQAVRDKKSLLLMAPGFDSEIHVFLSANKDLLKSCTVISPGHRNYRDILLKDIRALLGDSSECKKVIITKNNTTFIGCNSNKEVVDSTVKEIREIIEEAALPEFDLNFHKQRLANFTAGLATIYVGGYSPAEVRERYDRIEDAVCATQAALQEGIVPGGGMAFRYAEMTADSTLNNYKQLLELINVLLSVQDILETKDLTIEDMFKKHVIEPFLVTKTVLENAASTAVLILTANVAILNMNNFMD